MALNRTKISWADYTWNPVTGCTECSAGCRNCYAHGITERNNEDFSVTLHDDRLKDPYKEDTSSLIFVCSMSDLFHEEVPFSFIDKVLDITRAVSIHTYQLLTKRPERMAEYFSTREVPENVWLGTTVEKARYRNRIDILRNIEAPLRFLSCEPLLDDLGELNLDGIDWVIVGGEQTDFYSDRARGMKKEWVYKIKDQCDANDVLFHFKQWGTVNEDGDRFSTEHNGYELDGKVYRAIPPIRDYEPTIF